MRQSSVQGPGAQRRASGAETTERGGGPRRDGAGPGDLPGQRQGGRHQGGGPPAPGGKHRVLRWVSTTLAVLILGTAGAGYLYYEHLNGNLDKDDLNLGDNKLDKSAPNAAGQTPLNILLLGSDSRKSKENVKLGGARADRDRPALADVQMLLHVSADRSNMSVISVPRDTRVTIPRCTDKKDSDKVYPETSDTINSSLAHGGPGCTVATWEELTGIPIDHFMMIDFSGVVDMADAVGGVPVCVDNNVYDAKSGLRLKKGDSTIKGVQALQWLRTRHGFEDGSDIGRAKAQHLYMNSMVRQLKAGTKLTDPDKLTDLAEAATKALTVDDGLGTVKKLYDLGNDLKRVPTKRITMATMPWVPDAQNPAHVIPKPGDADKTFSLMRNDVGLDGKDKKKHGPKKKPVPSDPAAPKGEIPVAVQNGTGTAAQIAVRGRAATIAGQLTRLGFSQAATDATPKSRADTTVSYPKADQRGDAQAVAKALGLPDSAVRPAAEVSQVTLVIGADWRTGTEYPKSAGSEKHGDEKAPDSADALKGDDKSACMKVNPANVW
ncbi:LCP family protein [Streptomyces sp. bgisy100]|uniref:LCP family protein n=1 Tax=Streptomyces sp. bgisy100 TaxID=3413783 RepID=UPI003D728395